MIMLSNSKAKDMNVTEGQDAFQIFFEQFLYSIGHEYVDTVQCMTYNNQTGMITDHIYSADVALMSNNATALKEALISTNNLLINEVKNLSACGQYINQNVTQILQNNNKQL